MFLLVRYIQVSHYLPDKVYYVNSSDVCCSAAYKVCYLDLSMATVAVQTLEELLSSCVHLLRLSLESCQLNTNVCR